MNYWLEQALLDNKAREFLFTLEKRIFTYLQADPTIKSDSNASNDIEFYSLSGYQKTLSNKFAEFFKMSTKSYYSKPAGSSKQSSDTPSQATGTQGESKKQQHKSKKRQCFALFKKIEDEQKEVESPLNSLLPFLELQDYFTSQQMQNHLAIIEAKKSRKKKSSKQSQTQGTQQVNKEGQQDETRSRQSSTSSASQSSDEGSETDKNFLPSLTHIICLIKKGKIGTKKKVEKDEEEEHKSQEKQHDLIEVPEELVDQVPHFQIQFRPVSTSFAFLILKSEQDARVLMDKITSPTFDLIPLAKLDRSKFKDELANEYLEKPLQKPKSSVEVANRIIFGILGERKDIKNNSGDQMRALQNKD